MPTEEALHQKAHAVVHLYGNIATSPCCCCKLPALTEAIDFVQRYTSDVVHACMLPNCLAFLMLSDHPSI